MPRISVIIPVYGVEKYIERCARSLFEQTLDDIEYIFVDDCSPDNSIAILEGIIEAYPKRKLHTQIVRLQTNCGLPNARKEGIKIATGEYIIHCDSDDWLELNMYEEMYNEAVTYKCDVVVCDIFQSRSYESRTQVIQEIPKETMGIIKNCLIGRIHGSLCNKLVHRSIVQSVQVYPTDNMLEDLVLSIQYFCEARRVKYIQKAYYNYFVNDTSISKSNNIENIKRRFNQSISNFMLLVSYLDSKSLTDLLATEINTSKILIKSESSAGCVDPAFYKTWIHTFKEVKFRDLLRAKCSVRLKIKHILTALRIYPFIFF